MICEPADPHHTLASKSPTVSIIHCTILAASLAFCTGSPVLADETSVAGPSISSVKEQTQPAKAPWRYDPAFGLVYQRSDFKWTLWGYAERLFDPSGEDKWRRVRQGSEFDFPRLSEALRPAFVYEVDLTDSNFLHNGIGGRAGLGRRNFENLFVALQDPEDAGRFRVLAGENTHILSREDNLSSGNLPTINRSLILEDHSGVNSFGPQFGIEVQKALTPQYMILLSALDNRGSFNTDIPRYTVGNSLAAKLVSTPLDDRMTGEKLTWGLGVDNTQDIQNRIFPLLTAIAQTSLGGVPVAGDKISGEADIAYTFPLFTRPITLEAEGIYSSFSKSNSDVGGGYLMAQYSLFDIEQSGDLDVFVRYDAVSLGQGGITGRAWQQAIRTGFNYNLPYTRKLANLHLEFAHNSVNGPVAIVDRGRSIDEFRVEFRMSLQQYARH